MAEDSLFWERKRLKNVACHIVVKKTPKDGDITISPENVEPGTGRVLSFFSDYESDGHEFVVGDILFNKLRVYLQKVVLTSFSGVSLGEMIVLRPTNVYPNFLYWFLSSSIFIDRVNSLAQGVNLPRPPVEGILNQQVLLPPLDEQHLISRYLNKKTQQIDTLIRKIEKKIELLKEQRTSLINHYVTKGLDPNVEMKDSGVEWIGKIPKHWKMGRFKYYIDTLTDFTANGSFKALADNVEYLSEGFSRLVRLTDLREDLQNDGIFVSEEAHKFLKKSELFGGEILIANVGAYTGLALKMSKGKGVCTLGPNMFLVKNNHDVSDVDYTVHLLNADSTKKEFDLVISSTAQPKINKDNLRGLVVPIPPVKEQEEISQFINEKTKKLDLIVKAEEKRILVLKEYRQSLISRVVTGKLRVTEDMI